MGDIDLSHRMANSTKTGRATASKALTPYVEPLGSPGLIPNYLKRAATIDYPLIEIFQRVLFRLQPGGGATIENVLALVALLKVSRPVYRHLKDFFFWAFTSQVVISENDTVARQIINWVSINVIDKSVTTNAMIVSDASPTVLDAYQRRYTLRELDPKSYAEDSNEPRCQPPIGRSLFWVGFRPFLVSRSGHENTQPRTGRVTDGNGQVTLSTLGWSLGPLQDFIKLCRKFEAETMDGTTTMHFSSGTSGDPYSGGPWSSVVKAVRKLDTIDMDPDIKADLIRDAEYYYSAESKKFFADCGIPYRRGYMFYGPPGTGKTSFSAALAGHLKCDVYIINLATGDISDGRLLRLFLALPRKCVVVIEDIDSAGIGREEPEAPPADTQPPVSPTGVPGFHGLMRPSTHPSSNWQRVNNARTKRNKVTLSGLLNAIDGNASAEGRLLIMTSNSPEVLDEALTRPGRVDKKVYFGKIKAKATHDIFKRLIGRSAMAKLDCSEDQVEQYAQAFSEKLPEDAFTPAQIQNYLQSCKGDPIKALRDIDAWVARQQAGPPKERESQRNSAASQGNGVDTPNTAVNSDLDLEKLNTGLDTVEAQSQAKAVNGKHPAAD